MNELRAIDAEIDNIYDHFWEYKSSDLHRLYALRWWEQKRQEAAVALVYLSEERDPDGDYTELNNQTASRNQ